MLIIRSLLRFLLVLFAIATLAAVVNSEKGAFDYFYCGVAICMVFMIWQWINLVGRSYTKYAIQKKMITSTGSALLGLGVFMLCMDQLTGLNQFYFKGIGTAMTGLATIYFAHSFYPLQLTGRRRS